MLLARALAFLAFAGIFGWLGFFALNGLLAFLAKLLFALFAALFVGTAIQRGAHSCERREAADNAQKALSER